MAALSPLPKLQFFDSNGDPLVGGKLYTYLAGTSTPFPTYTDVSGAQANTNPVILDSRGEASVWLGSYQYKFVLKSAVDATIYTADNITGGSVQYQRQVFTATANQKNFTISSQYLVGTGGLVVFTNGKKEAVTLDYTEYSGTEFRFLVGKSVGDIVEAFVGLIFPSNGMTLSVDNFGAGTTMSAAVNAAAFASAWASSNPTAVYVPTGTYPFTGTVTGKFYSFGAVTISGGTVTSITNLVP